jgi:hypothetical protein
LPPRNQVINPVFVLLEENMKKLLLLIAITLLLNGCAPWIRTGGPYTVSEANVALDLPDGWMRLNTVDYFLITRDGVGLQNILVECIGVDDTLTHTKKKFRKGMLPLEAAEVILDNVASSDNVHGFAIKENKPVKIDGKQGFRAVYTYKNDDGLKKKGVVYGFKNGDRFYVLQYCAPQRYYFERDLKTFERVVNSAHLLNS